jgi:hypothetical protein
MYREGREGGNLSDGDAEGGGGFSLRNPTARRVASPYIAATIGTGEMHEKSRKVHARRIALKYGLVRFSYVTSFRFLHGGSDRLRQGTAFLHRSEPFSGITQDTEMVVKRRR